METDKTDVLVHYATKADLQGVGVELQAVRGVVQELRLEVHALHEQAIAQIREVRLEMQLMEARLRTEMALLRADMFRALNAQTWKMVGVVIAVNAATVGAVYYMVNG